MSVTLRLLSTYQGNKPGTIITVDDATGAALLKGGVNATTDLTGGVAAPAPPSPENQKVPARIELGQNGEFAGLIGPQGGRVLVVSSAAPSNADGRIDGTVYIQTP